MSKTVDLHAQLATIARYVRSPGTQAAVPGIEPRRLKLYGDLLLSNVEGLLAGNFPVIRKTLGDVDWQTLVQHFFATHRSQTPLFTQIGLELIAFLQTPAGQDPTRPWLAELAHYEWAELGLQLSDAIPPAHDPHGDLLDGVPVLSPLAWPLAYGWPVPRIGPDFQPEIAPPEPTLVLLQRNGDGKVQFSALSPLLFQLLERIGANTSASGRELLARLAFEANQQDVHGFIDAARPLLQQLHQQGVLSGARM
ncbi:MAG: putative DNA-binding domain-containing protein [Thermomonas sp.]